MKRKFKSLECAVRRIRELEHAIREREDLLNKWCAERKMLAKLSAESPQFSNPLRVAEAQRIRDAILREMPSVEQEGNEVR